MIQFDAIEREFTEAEQQESIFPIAYNMVQLEWRYARIARLYREWDEGLRCGAKDYDKKLRFGKLMQDLVDFRNWGETAFSEVFKALNLTSRH